MPASHPALVSPPAHGDDFDDREAPLEPGDTKARLEDLAARETYLATILASLEADPPDRLTPAALDYHRNELAQVRAEIARRSGTPSQTHEEPAHEPHQAA